MKDWAAASDKIRQRTAGAVLNSIEVDTPFAFDPGSDQSEMPDFLDSNWSSFERESDYVTGLPGRDLNLTRDILITMTKFFHVVECAREEKVRGSLTWAIVDLYHAALLGTRVISAYYGVLSYGVRGRTILVDYRPESGRVDDMKAFRRENRDIIDPIRLLLPKKKHLEQRDSWDLIIRLTAITKNIDNETDRIEGLSEISKANLSATRNFVLYDSVHWTWREDFLNRKLDAKYISKILSAGDENIQQLLNSTTLIYNIITDYGCEFCNRISFDISQIPFFARLPAKTLLLS